MEKLPFFRTGLMVIIHICGVWTAKTEDLMVYQFLAWQRRHVLVPFHALVPFIRITRQEAVFGE